MSEQVLGLLTGVLFGFLLQKGGLLRFDRQLGALLFLDMTIVKFMLSAVLVGSIGFQFMSEAGLITLNHTALNVGGVVVGGTLFGVGWAVAGFCPGLAVGALGEGRWQALFVIAGMLLGAALYAEAYPYLKDTVLVWKDYGKISFPQVLKVSPWQCIAVLWGTGVVTFVWCEFKHM
jgi:uncharacterized membrane protein YedE/YeeE